MTNQDPTWQYMTGQMRPGAPALLQRFQQDSDALPLTVCDERYGPDPRQVFDFIASPEAWRGTLAYFHAGFWQSRDKSQFRCIAPALLSHGIDVALVNYPLCPTVTLPQLVAAATASVPAILARAAAMGRGGARLTAAGHSAGAHIAAELALSPWPGMTPIQAIVALSGIYDLEPLLATPLNQKLRLDQPTARAISPVHRVAAGMPPALFAVGDEETAAFQAQTVAMHEAWRRAGNPSDFLAVHGADHFSLLLDLQRPGALLERVVRFAVI